MVIYQNTGKKIKIPVSVKELYIYGFDVFLSVFVMAVSEKVKFRRNLLS